MSIRADHISLSYNGQHVLDDFSFEMPSYGIVGLYGPSGCGKTTFLHCLAGLIQPDSGLITGILRHRTGVVFQEDRLLPWLTAEENLSLITRNQSQTIEWLQRVHLDEQAKYYPSELSGGMKRRITLARALAFDCDLLLLDEPFQGLDQELKVNMYDWVRKASLSKPVLMISHDWTEIDELTEEIYIAAGHPLSVERYKKNMNLD